MDERFAVRPSLLGAIPEVLHGDKENQLLQGALTSTRVCGNACVHMHIHMHTKTHKKQNPTKDGKTTAIKFTWKKPRLFLCRTWEMFFKLTKEVSQCSVVPDTHYPSCSLLCLGATWTFDGLLLTASVMGDTAV